MRYLSMVVLGADCGWGAARALVGYHMNSMAGVWFGCIFAGVAFACMCACLVELIRAPTVKK